MSPPASEVLNRKNNSSVIMTDPSLFTAAYDKKLCESLASEINNHHSFSLELWGRMPRAGEPCMYELPMYKVEFYRFSEKLRGFGCKLGIIALAMKVFEHFLTWIKLYENVIKFKSTLHLQWLVLPLVDFIFLKRLKGKIPLILTVHDTIPFLGSPTSKVQNWKWHETLKLFDKYIVHTCGSKKVLLEWGIPEKSIYMSPIGSTTDAQSISRQERGFKSILLFGSIKKYKGADLLFKAFTLIEPSIRAGWKIEIIGQLTHECSNLVGLAKDLGIQRDVIFDSRYIDESEIAQIAMNADIYCFPYRQIDMSGILMNFLPFGKPIIASGIGVFQDLLVHRQTAYLVPPEDIGALAEGLTQLICSESLRDQLGLRVKALDKTAETWQRAAEVHTGVYLERDLI